MGRFCPSHVMGISHIDAYFCSGHTFLFNSWDLGNGSHRGDGPPFSILALASKLLDSHDCISNIGALDEMHEAENKWLFYQKQINKAYNKRVKTRTLTVGDLIL